MAEIITVPDKPYIDQKSGFEFPTTIGPFQRLKGRIYEDEHPGYGFSFGYRTDKTEATIYVYDLNNGNNKSNLLEQEFDQMVGEIKGTYQNVIVKDSSACLDFNEPCKSIFVTYDFLGVSKGSLALLVAKNEFFYKLRITSDEQDRDSFIEHLEMLKTFRAYIEGVIPDASYFYEYGVKADQSGNHELAYHYYVIAAGEGHAWAQYNLGLLYKNGEGVSQDYDFSIKLFLLAAKQGLANAQHELALAYDVSENGPQSDSEAVKWYRLAADQGYPLSQINLARMYSSGRGVPQDHQQAVALYRLAADQGELEAQSKLAMKYERGEGVPQDYKEAVKWYRLAAENGFAPAQLNLGMMFVAGKGVQESEEEAFAWWWIAAFNGHELADSNINAARQKMNHNTISNGEKRASEIMRNQRGVSNWALVNEYGQGHKTYVDQSRVSVEGQVKGAWVRYYMEPPGFNKVDEKELREMYVLEEYDCEKKQVRRLQFVFRNMDGSFRELDSSEPAWSLATAGYEKTMEFLCSYESGK